MTENADEPAGMNERGYDPERLTLSLIGDLVDAHPNYRAVSHYAASGSRFVMVEIPPEPDAFTEGAPGAFVSMVAGFDTEDA